MPANILLLLLLLLLWLQSDVTVTPTLVQAAQTHTIMLNAAGSLSGLAQAIPAGSQIAEPWHNSSLTWVGYATAAAVVFVVILLRKMRTVTQHLDQLKKVVAEQSSNLEVSNEKYRWLIEGLHESYVLFTSTQDGLITHVSPSVKNVLGYEQSEIINMTWKSLMESGDSLDDTLKNALKRKTALVVEAPVRCKDGTARWLELTQFPLKNPSQADEQRECIAKDITQLKQVKENLTAARDDLERRVRERTNNLQEVNEQLNQEIEQHQATSRRLNQSELQYRSIVEDQTEMVIRFDTHGTLMFANRAYRERHSLTLESLHEFNVFSAVHPNDREAARQRVAAIQTSEPIRIPLMRTLDEKGNADWADWSGRALFDEDGVLLGYQGAGRIITDLVQAQQKLEESELQYRSIVEDQTEMILRFGTDGRVTFANTASAVANGMTPEESIGRQYLTRVFKDDRDNVRQIVASTTVEKPVQQFDVRCYRPDGTISRESWSCRALVDSSEELREYQAVGRDITELWETRRRLDEKEQQLTHLARISALGEMVAEISHEINQPLATIANFSSAARLVLVQPELVEDDLLKLRTWSEKTIQQTNKINAIIHRLRRFVRPGSEHERFCIKDAISEAVLVTEIRTRHSIQQIEVECPEDIPLIKADKIQIEQVIVNLIRNACDSMDDQPYGERRLSISVSATKQEISVCIADSGPGVPPELAAGIFNAFVTTKPDGMDIGLAISRSIIESHGGKIKTIADDGGRFVFSLPIHQHGAHD